MVVGGGGTVVGATGVTVGYVVADALGSRIGADAEAFTARICGVFMVAASPPIPRRPPRRIPPAPRRDYADSEGPS